MVVGGKTQPLDPEKPIVMTFYAPVPGPGADAATQGATGRAMLLATSFADYERQIREQMNEMFAAAGFDAARDIAGIVLNRWGHAYLAPEPGFRFGRNGGPGGGGAGGGVLLKGLKSVAERALPAARPLGTPLRHFCSGVGSG